MANTCMGDMVVVLPKEQKENFLSYFYNGDKEQKEYFDLSLDGVDETEIEGKNRVVLSISFDCRWSVSSAAIDLSEDKKENGVLSLMDVIKKTHVLYLYLISEEPGIGFREKVEYTYGDDLDRFETKNYESQDLWESPYTIDISALVLDI